MHGGVMGSRIVGLPTAYGLRYGCGMGVCSYRVLISNWCVV